jgi:hypothetical protein
LRGAGRGWKTASKELEKGCSSNPVFRGSDVEKASIELKHSAAQFLRTDVSGGESGRGGLRTVVNVDNRDRIEILGDYRQNFWPVVVSCGIRWLPRRWEVVVKTSELHVQVF